jgi:hypothetical protein
MTFDVRAAKDNLILLLTDTPGLQAVRDGAPESMPTVATAWVTIGDLVEPVGAQASSGRYKLCINLLVTIGFVVASTEEGAEDSVADAVTEIVRRVAKNRVGTVGGVPAMLNGSIETMSLPRAASMASDYIQMAGQETKTYPLAIEITQYESIS